jgi:hypothetical protein
MRDLPRSGYDDMLQSMASLGAVHLVMNSRIAVGGKGNVRQNHLRIQ